MLEQLRSGCDIMHLFFMFDEHSDKCGPEEVWEQARIQMDAFWRPNQPRPEGEWVGGEFARQYDLPSDARRGGSWEILTIGMTDFGCAFQPMPLPCSSGAS